MEMYKGNEKEYYERLYQESRIDLYKVHSQINMITEDYENFRNPDAYYTKCYKEDCARLESISDKLNIQKKSIQEVIDNICIYENLIAQKVSNEELSKARYEIESLIDKLEIEKYEI